MGLRWKGEEARHWRRTLQTGRVRLGNTLADCSVPLSFFLITASVRAGKLSHVHQPFHLRREHPARAVRTGQRAFGHDSGVKGADAVARAPRRFGEWLEEDYLVQQDDIPDEDVGNDGELIDPEARRKMLVR